MYACMWVRGHIQVTCGLVYDDYMESLKGRDQPVRCSDSRNEGEVAVLVDLSF